MFKFIVCGASIPLITLCVFLVFFPLVQICGDSMYPTLLNGEFFLGRRVLRKSKCRIGEIYVYKPPYDGREERYVIKRLADIQHDRFGNPMYYFLGDNSNDSYDSRYYGYVNSHNVVAHIVLKKRGVK